MPLGELAFNPCPAGTAFVSSVGIDLYAILKPSIQATSSGQTPQWVAVYIGNGTFALVGTYDTYSAAFNASQAHFTALAT